MMKYSDKETPLRDKYCAPLTRAIAIKCDVSFLVSFPFFLEEEDLEQTEEEELF